MNTIEMEEKRKMQIDSRMKGLIDEAVKGKKKSVYYGDIMIAFTGTELTQDEFTYIVDMLEKKSIELSYEVEEDNATNTLAFQKLSKKELDQLEDDTLEDSVKIYFRQMNKYPLLTVEQEIETCKTIEAGREAKQANEALRISFEKAKKAKHKTSDLAQQIKENDILIRKGEEAEQLLMNSNLRLVVSVARFYAHTKSLTFLDLVQEGNLGLIPAVRNFDYRKGYKFSTYAYWWIKQAITRGIADKDRTIRMPVHMVERINKIKKIITTAENDGKTITSKEIAQALDLTEDIVEETLQYLNDPASLDVNIGEDGDTKLGDLIPDPNSVSAEDFAFQNNTHEKVVEVLSKIPERERTVIIKRFGLDGYGCRTLEQTAEEISKETKTERVTRERIRQIEAKALRRLRHPKFTNVLRGML